MLVRVLTWRRSVTLAAGNPDPKPLDRMTVNSCLLNVEHVLAPSLCESTRCHPRPRNYMSNP